MILDGSAASVQYSKPADLTKVAVHSRGVQGRQINLEEVILQGTGKHNSVWAGQCLWSFQSVVSVSCRLLLALLTSSWKIKAGSSLCLQAQARSSAAAHSVLISKKPPSVVLEARSKAPKPSMTDTDCAVHRSASKAHRARPKRTHTHTHLCPKSSLCCQLLVEGFVRKQGHMNPSKLLRSRESSGQEKGQGMSTGICRCSPTAGELENKSIKSMWILRDAEPPPCNS